MKLEAWTINGIRVTTEEAALIHEPGDIYIDQKTGKWVQFHNCQKVRKHFEFMRNQDRKLDR